VSWLKQGMLDGDLFRAFDELCVFEMTPGSKDIRALQNGYFADVCRTGEGQAELLTDLDKAFSGVDVYQLLQEAALEQMLSMRYVSMASADLQKEIQPEASRALWAMKYPVTQLLWYTHMGVNPSKYLGPAHPVERISWFEAICFCNRLSEAQGFKPVYQFSPRFFNWLKRYIAAVEPIGWRQWLKDGQYDRSIYLRSEFATDAQESVLTRLDAAAQASVWIDEQANGFRMPTEGEWKVCAQHIQFSSQQAHCQHFGALPWSKDFRKTHLVGGYPCNDRGLFDVLGNVWEWCWDEWSERDLNSEKNQSAGQRIRAKRVIKGGSWATDSTLVNPAYREHRTPEQRAVSLGLRLVRRFE